MYLRLPMMVTANTPPVLNSTRSSSKTYITISELGPFDVLCGRSKACWNNVGNLRFREVINAKLPMYLNSGTNFMRCLANREIAKELLDTNNPRGSFRFFKRASDSSDGCSDDERTLVELLDEKESSTKIAQALRDSAVRHKKRRSRNSGTKFPKVSTVESDSSIGALRPSLLRFDSERSVGSSNVGSERTVESTVVSSSIRALGPTLTRFDSERTIESSNFGSERTVESTVVSSSNGEPYDETIAKIALSNNSVHIKTAAGSERTSESTVLSSSTGEPYDETIAKMGLSNNSVHMKDAAGSERTTESTVVSSSIGEPYDDTITNIGLSNNSVHMNDAKLGLSNHSVHMKNAAEDDVEENHFSSLFSELMVAEIGEVTSDEEDREQNCSFSSLPFFSSMFGEKAEKTADAQDREESCNVVSSAPFATDRESSKKLQTEPSVPVSSGICSGEELAEAPTMAEAPTRLVGSSGGNNDFIVEGLRAPSSSAAANTNSSTRFSLILKKHLALSQKVHDEMICRYRKEEDVKQDSSS